MTTQSLRRELGTFTLLLLTHSILVLHSKAADWTGDGATTNWSNNGNWSFGIPLGNNPNDPVPVFMVGNTFGGGHTTSVADHDWHISQLTFANHVLSNNVYTVSGDPLTIHGGGVNNESGVNGQVVNNNITLVNPSSGPGNFWSVTNDLIVAGDIGGDALLRKFGTGKLSLRGHVTLAALDVTEGTIRLGLGDIISNDTRVCVNLNGTLELPSTGLEAIGQLFCNGHVMLNSDLSVGNDNLDSSFAGRFSGPGGLTKDGTAQFNLGRGVSVSHNTYTGPTIVNGGILRVHGDARLPNASQLVVNSAGTFLLDGPTDAVFGLDGSGTVELDGGHLVLGNFVSTGNFPGNGDFSGLIEGTGALSKRGTGTQTLRGSSTYSGNTTVSEGTLIVANLSGSATGSGTVTVESSGTLGGNGRITGQLNVAGTVAPSGTLTVQNLTLQPGSKLKLDIDGMTPGSEYDQVLANSVTQAGTLEISLGPNYTEPTTQGQWNEFTLIEGDTFNADFGEVRYESALIELGYISGHPSGDGFFRHLTNDGSALTLVNYLALPGDANGDGLVDGVDFLVWNTNKFASGTDWATGDFNADGITDGQDFVMWNTHKFTSADQAANVSAVPEPHGLSLLLLSMFALFSRPRFRRVVASIPTSGRASRRGSDQRALGPRVAKPSWPCPSEA